MGLQHDMIHRQQRLGHTGFVREHVQPGAGDAPLRQPVAGLAVVAAAVAAADRPPRPLVLLLPPVMRALAPTPLRSWPTPLPGVGAYRMRP